MQNILTFALRLVSKLLWRQLIIHLVAFKNWNGVDTLKNIKNETLIIWGDQDKSYNFRASSNFRKKY